MMMATTSMNVNTNTEATPSPSNNKRRQSQAIMMVTAIMNANTTNTEGTPPTSNKKRRIQSEAMIMVAALMNVNTNTEATPSPSINKKRIHFAPIVQVFHVLARNEFTQAEKESYWCSNLEQQEFRVSAMKLVIETRKTGHGFISMIDKSYEMAQHLSMTLKPHQIESVLRDPRRYTEQLEAFTLIGEGRRGLEKFTSTYHRQARRPIVQATKTIVCDMSRSGIADEEIAELYGEQSRTSLVYSRMVGSADYRTAYWEEQIEWGMMY